MKVVNDGPLGAFFRYICDNGAYIARYDDVADGREPNSSVELMLGAYRTLHTLEESLL